MIVGQDGSKYEKWEKYKHEAQQYNEKIIDEHPINVAAWETEKQKYEDEQKAKVIQIWEKRKKEYELNQKKNNQLLMEMISRFDQKDPEAIAYYFGKWLLGKLSYIHRDMSQTCIE